LLFYLQRYFEIQFGLCMLFFIVCLGYLVRSTPSGVDMLDLKALPNVTRIFRASFAMDVQLLCFVVVISKIVAHCFSGRRARHHPLVARVKPGSRLNQQIEDLVFFNFLGIGW